MQFEKNLETPVPRQFLHDWHLRPGAFERLGPPWVEMRHVHADPVANGAKRIFDVKRGGVWLRWIAHHENVVPPEQFTDTQEKGPFKRWEHTHRFEVLDEGTSRLVDHIDYEVPLGFVGRALAGGSIEADIERMFRYRHCVTLGDLRTHAPYIDRGPLRIAVTGASGLLGTQLVAMLRTGGHEVLRLVRTDAPPADDEVRWDLDGVKDLAKLEGVHAIVHLAGASVAQRWTDAAKRSILESRELGTRAVVAAIGKLSERPRCLVSASAIGFYGDTGDAIVDEHAPLGSGFLADVCEAWEREARRAEDHGVRTTRLRIGVVMDPRGGALAKLLPVFGAGMGGRVGSGQQLVSWVGLDDVLGTCVSAIHEEDMDGPINVTGPRPVTQEELAKTLGRVLGRPTIAPAPSRAIEMMYGEMGRETVLASTGARPAKLVERGYVFRAPTLEDALRHCLGRSDKRRGTDRK